MNKKDKNDKDNKIESKSLKRVNDKENISKRFINNIKKRWLISGTNTILLIAILIAIFILVNQLMKKLDLTAIDCTKDKTYTLTSESKDRVKGIDKDVQIYIIGYSDNSAYDLIKQYKDANSKINVENKDITTDLEFANKHQLSNGDQVIVVESGESYRTLSSYDLLTYDSSYNTIDLTEEKVTSAILNVTEENIPNVYFLSGYSSVSFENGLSYLKLYLQDEVLNFDTVDLLISGKVPDNCDTLVIINPEKDFNEITTNAIIDYINRGGNIIWLGDVHIKDLELPNINKVLANYGISKFEKGFVYETNSSNVVQGIYPNFFKPEVQHTDVTSKIYDRLGVIFLDATKINIDTDKLSELNVEETNLVLSSSTSYFSTDVSGKTSQSTDQKGEFVLGDLLVKTISSDDSGNEIKSKLIIYGDYHFITDYPVSMYDILLTQFNNKDLFLNSIAYLTNKDVDLTIRKDYTSSTETYTPTEKELSIIMTTIFAVPLAIILAGIIVKIIRKSKK